MAADAALDLSRFDVAVLEDFATQSAVRFAMARPAPDAAPEGPRLRTLRRSPGTRGVRSDHALRDLAGVAA